MSLLLRSTPTPCADLDSYRCAVALNNMGVALLERCAYRQALDTLKDAVVLMRGVFDSTPLSRRNQRDRARHCTVLLEKAYHRTAHPQPAPGHSMVEILSPSGTLAAISSLLHRHGPALLPPCFPIKIENFDQEARNADLDSAMVLHNFATAHLCLSRFAPTALRAIFLRKAALRLAKLSHQALSNVIVVYHERFLDESVLGEANLVLIAGSVLNTIVRIQLESGQLDGAEEAYRKLRLLGSVVGDDTGTQPAKRHSEEAAAAA